VILARVTDFVTQQGFSGASSESCAVQYPALMFQPRLITATVAIGVFTQSAPLFLALGFVLLWCALVPRWNPFDRLYAALVARPRGTPPLVAPPPRRFAQGLAATLMLGVGLLLLRGHVFLAWILEAIVAVALTMLVLGRFCLGSYLYHRLPWRRS
jgi:hypothetical protein